MGNSNQSIIHAYVRLLCCFRCRDNDFHQGILQSIGFKEFVVYLEKYDREHDQLITDFMRGVSGTDGSPPEGLPLLQKCLDNLKLVTRRYSKKQIKWINHRFLGNSRREVIKICYATRIGTAGA